MCMKSFVYFISALSRYLKSLRSNIVRRKHTQTHKHIWIAQSIIMLMNTFLPLKSDEKCKRTIKPEAINSIVIHASWKLISASPPKIHANGWGRNSDFFERKKQFPFKSSHNIASQERRRRKTVNKVSVCKLNMYTL